MCVLSLLSLSLYPGLSPFLSPRVILYPHQLYRSCSPVSSPENFHLSRADSFVVGGSLIAEVLLLNASVLGMAQGGLSGSCISPLDSYKETKVMNNYFGIGLDAKIALDFHNKREGSEKVTLLLPPSYSSL